MDLSAAQRKLLFAVVVFVLAALGVYLFTSSRHATGTGTGQHGGAQAGPTTQPGGQSTAPPDTSPPATGPVSPSAAATRVPDIYQWLPFTKAGLAGAATVVVRFGDAYGTYSYTQKAAAYVGSMQNLITTQLASQIASAYSTPGVTSLRLSRKQVSVGSAQIVSMRAFGPTSITFLMNLTTRLTATKDGGTTTTEYAVTVTGTDTSWQVSDVEPSGAGNS
jgi:hypothetical protein